MKSFFKEYFSFGKSERIAIVIVLGVIVLLILLPRFYDSRKSPESFDAEIFKAEIEAFRKVQERSTAINQREFDYNNPDKSAAREKIRPFTFDPNVLDEEGWVRLGFSEKQAAGIVKYRLKGGRFEKKEDLKKLFVITAEVYELLAPFVQIENLPPAATQVRKEYTAGAAASRYNPTQHKTELNSADSAALVKVYGIGPATARRIIKYRSKLGGFADIEQLREVYSIDSARFAGISKNVFTDISLITKININTASVEEMRKHPYIDYYIAKAIVDRRIKGGGYSSPDEIREIALIYDELYLKMRPYLTSGQPQ